MQIYQSISEIYIHLLYVIPCRTLGGSALPISTFVLYIFFQYGDVHRDTVDMATIRVTDSREVLNHCRPVPCELYESDPR
jgi:hypothetical protein